MKVKELVNLLEKEKPEAEVILYVYMGKDGGVIDVSEAFDVEVQPGYEDVVRILGTHENEEVK